MKVTKTSSGGGLSQQEMTDAFIDALETVDSDEIVDTRYNDNTLNAIPVAGGTPIEINVDSSTPGIVLAAAVKSMQLSCTFGVPIEIMAGASAIAATRRAVANLGEGPQNIVIKIAAGERVYARSLNASSASTGVLTINFMG
jgi:hypothetical protein